MINVNITTDEDGVAIYVANEHILTIHLDEDDECKGITMHKDIPVEESDRIILNRDPVVQFLQECEKKLELDWREQVSRENRSGRIEASAKLEEVKSIRNRWEEHLREQMKRKKE